MEPVTITFSIISAIGGIVRAFETGFEFYKKWRKNRNQEKPAESELEESLQIGSATVNLECTNLARKHGVAFDRGDETSKAALLKISLDLNQSLVDVLRSSLELRRPNSVQPLQLWNVSEQAQKQAIGEMIDLSRRLQVTAPIPRSLSQRRGIYESTGVPKPSVMIPSSEQHKSGPVRETIPYAPRSAGTPQPLAVDSSPLFPNTRPKSVISLPPDSPSSSFTSQVFLFSSLLSPIDPPQLLSDSIFPDTDGRTSSDLLQEWKEDLDARHAQLYPRPPASPVHLPPPRSVMRHSSAPTTPFLNPKSPQPNNQSFQSSSRLSPFTPRPVPGTHNNRESFRRSLRVRSDSYVPSSSSDLNAKGDLLFPETSLEAGFTHSLPNSPLGGSSAA